MPFESSSLQFFSSCGAWGAVAENMLALASRAFTSASVSSRTVSLPAGLRTAS